VTFFVFRPFLQRPWFKALEELREALAMKDRDGVATAYALLFGALVQDRAADLLEAVAEDLLFIETPVSEAILKQKELPSGLQVAAQQDLEYLLTLLHHDWHAEASRLVGRSLPALKDLAPASSDERLHELKLTLKKDDPVWLLSQLIEGYQQYGSGLLGRYKAFRWLAGKLEGIAYPTQIKLERLVGLERQLSFLKQNTLAFLRSKPAHHALLYGPRGSGKSTAVRGLLPLYEAAGLRLIELAPHDLVSLPTIIEQLRFRLQRFVLFVDDLSFEGQDNSYHPLKTLLEGSLTERAENMLIYATSNRRHLVKEQFSDRPDPLNDDVHGWDTQNERLALADRFGLTITFPSATQQRYLELVRGLAVQDGLVLTDLEERAIRFADWGNGYSGRTAQQFIDQLKAEWH
jgi:hypothetical protein